MVFFSRLQLCICNMAGKMMLPDCALTITFAHQLMISSALAQEMSKKRQSSVENPRMIAG